LEKILGENDKEDYIFDDNSDNIARQSIPLSRSRKQYINNEEGRKIDFIYQFE
jgi:hypothetical protein